MKLLKCHVEHFGKLSNFDYCFSDGLTVIREPNGFGKSTFAAFIKAMLYGFPRTAARSVTGNERKKYFPWQGEKYGGSLDFEFEGNSYQVRRTFGKTAAKDSFFLLDLTNNRESKRFTEKLGEELFQLDAESFMRSVYMPQIQNMETAVTTSIQTKLSNLVDNTDDLNNYDSAMERLRTMRSNYRKFRGNGGRIDEVQNKIEQMERELESAEHQREELEKVTENVEKLNADKINQEESVSALREKITKASTRQVDQTLREQFAGFEQGLSALEKEIQKLNEDYPKGYPSKEEVRLQNKKVTTAQQAQNELDSLVLNEEDTRCEERGRILFFDEARTTEEIQKCQRDCNELSEVTAQAGAQMSRGELEQYERLKKRFQGGLPSAAELQKCKDAANLLANKRGAFNAQQLTVADDDRLAELSDFFQGKSIDEEELTRCGEAQGRIKEYENKINQTTLSETEMNEWKRLSRVFSIEVPEDDDIRQKQSDCRRIDELNSKKETKTTVFQQIPKKEAEKFDGSKALIAIGTLLIISGIACFLLSRITVGAILAILGFAVVLGAFWIHTQKMVKQGAGRIAVESSAISETEMQELYTLQKDVTEFIMKFYEDASEPNAKLNNLLFDKKTYLQIQRHKSELEKEREAFNKEIDAQWNDIHEVFKRYYPNQPYQERFVVDLRNRWYEYKNLQSRQNDIQQEREKLNSEIGRIGRELQEVLSKYNLNKDTGSISIQLQKLESDANELARLDSRWIETRENREKAEGQKQRLIAEIETVLKKYNVYLDNQSYGTALDTLRESFGKYKVAAKNVTDYCLNKDRFEKQKAEAERELEQFACKYGLREELNEERLSQILDDITNYDQKVRQKMETIQKIENFKNQHPEFKKGIKEEQQEDLPAVNVLIDEKRVAEERLREANDKLQAVRGERKRLLQIVEEIPEKEDQLNELQEQRKADEQSCDILDKTLNLLETAKNNLSNQYIGGVERGFASYVHELLGNDFSNAFIEHDLTIRVDEKGEAREIDYFSAGTIDSIMLCMRLALVDALFKQEKPFLLLDDPFVNLDDQHTERALAMLREIAKNKQVVYMVCNSSRC